MRLVLPFSFTRLSLPVSLLLLSLVPGSYVLPSSTHAPWKTTHTSTDYTIIWSQMKNCIITQAPLVESLISFQSCIIILAHVLLSGFSRVGPSAVRVLSGYSGTSSILLLYHSTDPLAAYCGSLYFFSALHDVCERIFFNITGHAATVYPHCFLDCLRHPIISYRQNASRSNFLGPSSSACFLGFSLVLYVSSDWYRRKQVLIFIRFMVNSFRTTSLYLDCWFYWRVWNAGRRPLQHLIHSTTPAPTSLRL